MKKENKKKQNLNPKKICLNTILICVMVTLIAVMYFSMKNSFSVNNESYSISTNNSNTNEQDSNHLRYITKDSAKNLKETSEWNTNKTKKKILNDTLNSDTNTVKSYTVQGSKD